MAKINSVQAVLSNSDLLIEILTCVPPKPLTTFKIVSKHWLSLISDPHFLAAQTRHYITTHPLSSHSIFHYQNIPISIGDDEYYGQIFAKLHSIEGVRHYDEFTIHNSCNGLMLCQYGCTEPYIVFNPTTQKHKLLPKPLTSLGYRPALGTVLAFDPLKSFHYKIVRFCSVRYPDCILDIDIFSSESGTWKVIHLQEPPLSDFEMIFWNGAIHWMAIPNIHVRFIVDEEKLIWDRIPTIPDTFPEGGEFGYFGKSDNGLLLIKSSPGEWIMCGWTKNWLNSDEVFTVLEMDKDNYWSPKLQVDLKPLVSKYPEMSLVAMDGRERLNYSVLYVKTGNENEDFSIVLAIPKKFIVYEVRKGNGGTNSKVLYEFPYGKLLYGRMHPLIESLAPVL